MAVHRSAHRDSEQPVVELIDVSRRFIKRRERHRSFQERFIRMLSRRNVDAEEFWPLRNVSMRIHPGDALGVIGPNGAGKSTLLKLVTGILTPTSGDMTVYGRVCSLLELGAGFNPELTGRENIFLNGSIYGLSRGEMNLRVDDIVDYAELGDFIDTPVKHYSSGMYMRLGFAVAVHTDPDLLLVDEVLSVGDSAFQHKCLATIQQFHNRGGTLLFVSHDLSTVQSVCNRAMWLEHGAIQAEGNPTDVAMRYLAHMAQHEEEVRRQREGTTGSVEPLPEAPNRWGNGKVRITRVELDNGDGEPRTSFQNGDPMFVRIFYYAPVRIERPTFGLAIHHRGGAHICGPNTHFGGLDIAAIEGDGQIIYQVPALPLLEGEYLLSVSVHDERDTETYDYHDRQYKLQVYPGLSNERYGLFALNGVWTSGAVAEPRQAVAPTEHAMLDA